MKNYLFGYTYGRVFMQSLLRTIFVTSCTKHIRQRTWLCSASKKTMPQQFRDPQASSFKKTETMQNRNAIINRDELRIRWLAQHKCYIKHQDIYGFID